MALKAGQFVVIMVGIVLFRRSIGDAQVGDFSIGRIAKLPGACRIEDGGGVRSW